MLKDADLIDFVKFPNPLTDADEQGIVAVEGELSPEFLISAYRQGIFPWFNPEEPIIWWCPDPRCILEFGRLKISKSFRQWLKKQNYTVKCDTNFENVVQNCQWIKRKNEDSTWISEEIVESYTLLHHLGIGHSIEVFNGNNVLVGGLYGLSMGNVFYGESMFSHETNTSKLAFLYLERFLKSKNFAFIDCQVTNSHLLSLGCSEISREEFLARNQKALSQKSFLGSWTHEFNKFGKEFEIG